MKPDTKPEKGQKESLVGLYKTGSITGNTVGHYNRIKQHVHLTWDEKSTRSSELAVNGIEKCAFARPGDSGSAVFTKNGEWVGILFGGVEVKQTDNAMTYVTAATAILEHLQKVMNKPGEQWTLEVMVP